MIDRAAIKTKIQVYLYHLADSPKTSSQIYEDLDFCEIAFPDIKIALATLLEEGFIHYKDGWVK
jgi:hypothetical protein